MSSICFWTSTPQLASTSEESTGSLSRQRSTKFFTRISLPVWEITSIKILESTSSASAIILFTRSPHAPLSFHVSPAPPKEPFWHFMNEDTTPGSQASHNETFAMVVEDARHALDRLLDASRCLAHHEAEIFKGKIWTGKWPTMEDSMQVPDLLTCLEGIPCSTEWGHGEMTRFSYLHLWGGDPITLSRLFVYEQLPPLRPLAPMPSLVSLSPFEAAVHNDAHAPPAISLFSPPYINFYRKSEEDQENWSGSEIPFGLDLETGEGSAAVESSSPFVVERDWTGRQSPSAYYLTPPPEETLDCQRWSSFDYAEDQASEWDTVFGDFVREDAPPPSSPVSPPTPTFFPPVNPVFVPPITGAVPSTPALLSFQSSDVDNTSPTTDTAISTTPAYDFDTFATDFPHYFPSDIWGDFI
ncbi:hypothetical protein T439DRAFT_326484 [Meredithblackwellia eburnea MCA 4105]